MKEVLKAVSMEEVIDKIASSGREVDINTYQLRCINGRSHTFILGGNEISPVNEPCANCPLSSKRNIKGCFGIITSLELENFATKSKVPTAYKYRRELEFYYEDGAKKRGVC